MTTDLVETPNACSHKGFSEWWSAETEYVLQRIERWAAFAKGYNRLRSDRLSRGRIKIHTQEQQWTYVANNYIVNDDSECKHIRQLETSQTGKNITEEMKLNCCGTFNYKSNGNLDSNCLEIYSFDHSIYFKTVGDIRKNKHSNYENKNDSHEMNKNDDRNIVECRINTEDILENVIETNKERREDMKMQYNYEELVDKTDPIEPNNNYFISHFDDQHLVMPM